MKTENEQKPAGFKLYYCVKCGFARVFWSDQPQFTVCPACGNDIYVESSLNLDHQSSAEEKNSENPFRRSYITNNPRI